MRTLQEIRKDKEEIQEKIYSLKDKLRVLEKEEDDIRFLKFCEKHGLQAGDIVEITNRSPMQTTEIVQVVGYDRHGITIRKIKKNGEPYANTSRYYNYNIFDGCKLVGHKPIEGNE